MRFDDYTSSDAIPLFQVGYGEINWSFLTPILVIGSFCIKSTKTFNTPILLNLFRNYVDKPLLHFEETKQIFFTTSMSLIMEMGPLNTMTIQEIIWWAKIKTGGVSKNNCKNSRGKSLMLAVVQVPLTRWSIRSAWSYYNLMYPLQIVLQTFRVAC